MSYVIVWSETALSRLYEIGDFLDRRQPGSAAAVLQRLMDQAGHTPTRHPRIGPQFAASRDPDLRELIVDSHRIIYRVVEARRAVHILTVRHGRERPLPANDLPAVPR